MAVGLESILLWPTQPHNEVVRTLKPSQLKQLDILVDSLIALKPPLPSQGDHNIPTSACLALYYFTVK